MAWQTPFPLNVGVPPTLESDAPSVTNDQVKNVLANSFQKTVYYILFQNNYLSLNRYPNF